MHCVMACNPGALCLGGVRIRIMCKIAISHLVTSVIHSFFLHFMFLFLIRKLFGTVDDFGSFVKMFL